MSSTQRRVVLAGLALALVMALTAVVTLWPVDQPAGGDGAGSGAAAADAGGGAVGARSLAALRAQAPSLDAGLPPSTATSPDVLASFGWGAGDGQLGRDRPQEGNPEAPMSLTVDAQGNVWVLDQVNQRLVKLDKAGKRLASVALTVQAGQDVAVAKDGTVAVLDRLVDKAVALHGPDGKLLGELKLEGKGFEETGAATGLFTDGEDVYAEREHGDLVKLGTTKGKADAERPEVPGRPSRDGTSWLTANLVDNVAGTVMVTAVERPSQAHRFTRQYALGAPLLAITLLDSDRSGVIYLGLLAETATSTAERPDFAVTLLCLDPLDGRPLGRTSVPANASPDETFREFTVLDEGGVLYLYRTEQGAQVRRVGCW